MAGIKFAYQGGQPEFEEEYLEQIQNIDTSNTREALDLLASIWEGLNHTYERGLNERWGD